MDALPDAFVDTIIALYGKGGSEWLSSLPVRIAECEQRWSIAVIEPLENLTFNYVASAVDGSGGERVLKLGIVNPELRTEIAALRLFDGRGSVQLLAADPEQGALLLERLSPGVPLSTLADDEQATSIAAGLMRQLWQPVPAGYPFPSVARWAAGLGRLRAHFGGATGPLPTALVEQAEALFWDLLISMDEPVLLHGDLHHDNILAARRQPWLAIDPKGVVGEPAYELGALLRNPWPRLLAMPQPGRILARRVDQLSAELAFDRARIIGWGIAQAVLSAWWCLEDGSMDWEYAIGCAELLAELA